jgi:DNA-binding MarR family transcriptional regulator
MVRAARPKAAPSEDRYVLEEQAGFILRQVNQRHAGIFAALMEHDLTPTQWAAMAKLLETGPCSQNRLGRLTAMDAATIKGVIDRLIRRGFAATRPDPANKRRHLVELTEEGYDVAYRAEPCAKAITGATLAPLSSVEQALFLTLLMKLR